MSQINRKYILIVAILAAIVGGGIYGGQYLLPKIINSLSISMMIILFLI